jgi:hypothetical protein
LKASAISAERAMFDSGFCHRKTSKDPKIL